VGAALVYLPVRYHDLNGWHRHCVGLVVRPPWCSHSEQNSMVLSSSFSLYRHIQHKHWNVGIFRYYEWKQVPNFLLAAPILVLSITGVYRWIHWSLITVYGKGKIPVTHKSIVFGWPPEALSESVSVSSEENADRGREAARNTDQRITLSTERNLLLENPWLLGHYAILAILAFLGLVIAHVQISTRMICSSSPAIIWFIAHCLLAPSSSSSAIDGSSKPNDKEQNFNSGYPFIGGIRSRMVLFYVGLYMVLGVILHVNFLPWT